MRFTFYQLWTTLIVSVKTLLPGKPGTAALNLLTLQLWNYMIEAGPHFCCFVSVAMCPCLFKPGWTHMWESSVDVLDLKSCFYPVRLNLVSFRSDTMGKQIYEQKESLHHCFGMRVC